MFVAVRPQLQCVFFYSCKGLSIKEVAIFGRERSKIEGLWHKSKKVMTFKRNGVCSSGKYDDIIYEWPQEQQHTGVVLGAVHKVRQHFLGRMFQTLRKKWQQIGIKSAEMGEGCFTNSKTSADVIYGRPSTYYVVGE